MDGGLSLDARDPEAVPELEHCKHAPTCQKTKLAVALSQRRLRKGLTCGVERGVWDSDDYDIDALICEHHRHGLANAAGAPCSTDRQRRELARAQASGGGSRQHGHRLGGAPVTTAHSAPYLRRKFCGFQLCDATRPIAR